jgi:hypothetical protein
VALRQLVAEALEDRTLLSTLTQLSTFNPALPPSDSAGGVQQLATSADGRFTAYASTAPNQVAGQVNTAVAGNVFLYDRQAGTTTLVSHAAGSATTGGDGDSDVPRVSGDGRYVLFQSKASNLVPGQAGPRGKDNVFLYDRLIGANTLLSHRYSSPTTTGNDDSLTFYTTGFGFNANSGQYLLFSSSANDLLPGQSGPPVLNLFLYNTSTGATTLISHNASSPLMGANDFSERADLTPDGSAVVFDSFATDVVAQQAGPTDNVFLYSPTAGTRLLSGVFTGSGNSLSSAAGNSFEPLISANGRTVCFIGTATNLVANQSTSSGPGIRNVFAYDTLLNQTSLVSGANGSPSVTANADSAQAVVSADGSTIGFLSNATNLTAGQGGNAGNAFLYGTSSGTPTLTLASYFYGFPGLAAGAIFVYPSGTQSELNLSASGRFLSYVSYAADMVAGQTNPSAQHNVFVYDASTTQNTLVSRVNGSPNVGGNQQSLYARLSADGSTVAFLGFATNLIPNVNIADGGQNLYLFNLSAGTGPTLASRSAFPATATSVVYGSSADGRYVVFTTNEPQNVVPGQIDNNLDQDVFLLDRNTGATTLVSHVPASSGQPPTAGNLGSPDTVLQSAASAFATPSVSADGNWVVFVSPATDLVANAPRATSTSQVFLFNRQTGVVTLVSHDSGSATIVANDSAVAAAISADGRFIAYQSHATNLVPGFSEQATGIAVLQVFLYDRNTDTTTLVSHVGGQAALGGEKPSLNPVISDDGRYVAYTSGSVTLVSGATINRPTTSTCSTAQPAATPW